MTNDNGVTTRAHELVRDHGRQTIAVMTAAALLWWVHLAPVGPARFAAVVGAVLLIALTVIDPHLRRQEPRYPELPAPPADPTDDQAFMYQLQMMVLDTRAEMAERDEVIDTILAGLQSSASGVAYTSGRLRRRLDRTVGSHTS